MSYEPVSYDAHTRPSKEIRRNVSLERKLTLLEFGRRLGLLISTDIFIIMLFFGATFFRCWGIAQRAVESGQSGAIAGAGYTVTEISGAKDDEAVPELSEGYMLYNKTFNWHGIVAGKSAMFGDIARVWFDEIYYGRPIRTLETLRCSFNITDGVPGSPYRLVTFELYDTIIVFENTFAILLVTQGLGLIFSVFKIRRSIRRTLRPIYDLTLAARNINMKSGSVMALPGSELHLSGAIDTLNNITENDLGRRIVISDERQELAGLAEAINAMLDRLDAAYSSQLRFVSDASHELRTPIAVIQGYANLLDRWGKNDQVTLQESIDAIKTESAGMQDLVEQLLFLARSDNRSIVLNVEDVDLCALADETLRETRMIDPGHEFLPKLEGSLTARGDAQLLKQALRIFVDNAIKYTPSGGRITVSAAQDNDYAKISVTDNGIGIPPDDLPRVFDRFFRADESRARETGGTGLGLSIAKWIIDRHGGFVEIISRIDIGTRVTIALPILRSGEKSPTG